jgi:hypothetical protein
MTAEMRSLSADELDTVSGGNPIIVGVILFELFTLGAMAGYAIADQRLPSQYQDIHIPRHWH